MIKTIKIQKSFQVWPSAVQDKIELIDNLFYYHKTIYAVVELFTWEKLDMVEKVKKAFKL